MQPAERHVVQRRMRALLGGSSLCSTILHAAALAALLWRPNASGGPPSPPTAEVEVQLVRLAATKRGSVDAVDLPTPSQSLQTAASPSDQSAAPTPLATPSPAPSEPQRPEAAAAQALNALPSSYANVPLPAPRPDHGQGGAPAVNLGNGDEDLDALNVSGDNVVSEGPDARYHNLPPRYPHDAARAHQHGTVSLLIHVTSTGVAGEVEVVDSSGTPSMDDSARIAVSRWRFKPPVRDGVAVRSVYRMRVDFVDDER